MCSQACHTHAPVCVRSPNGPKPSLWWTFWCAYPAEWLCKANKCHHDLASQGKKSLKAFQSAFTQSKTALRPKCCSASFLLVASLGLQSCSSCLCKGWKPVAKLCKLQTKTAKIWSKVAGASLLWSKQVKGMRRFAHSGTPGSAKFMTSRLCDLSQLYGTPSAHKANGIREAVSSSVQALRQSLWPSGPKPSQEASFSKEPACLRNLQSHSCGSRKASHSFCTTCFFGCQKSIRAQ